MSKQREPERSCVGKHVPSVRQKRETSGEPTHDELDEEKRERQTERSCESSRGGSAQIVMMVTVPVPVMIVVIVITVVMA